jgi:tripartite-type tricarboxylate transporter receptor subunit TctC
MVHVPYKGGGPAAIALLSGEVSLTFGSISTVLPQVRSGKVRALAATGSRRAAAAPQIPTISEAGVPGYELNSWYGVLAPGATPAEIVAKLGAEIARIVQAPDVRERLAREGVEPAGTSPAEFSAYIRSEIEKWAKVVKASGARVD